MTVDWKSRFSCSFHGVQADTIWTAATSLIVDPSSLLFPNLGPFQSFTTEREKGEKPKGVKSVPVTTYNTSLSVPFPAISIEFALSGSTTPHKLENRNSSLTKLRNSSFLLTAPTQ